MLELSAKPDTLFATPLVPGESVAEFILPLLRRFVDHSRRGFGTLSVHPF